MKKQTQKPGFTLVELLVVISIIALLISLVIPSLTGAKESARLAKCLSNQRGFGQALFLYSEDYDEQLPPLVDGAGNTWDTLLMDYLGGSVDVFICPSDPLLSDGPKTNRSYAVNAGAAERPFGDASNPPHTLSRLKTLNGRIVLTSERMGASRTDRGFIGETAFSSLRLIPSTMHRKGEGGNYLWNDMSVSYLVEEEMDINVNTNYWELQP